MIKKAIVLAAGKSERMGPLTLDRPKCLLPIGGKPIIQYQIDGLRAAGVEDILMVVGYKKEAVAVIESLGQGIRYRFYESYASTNNLHTLWSVADELDSACFVTFADIICNPDVFKSMAFSNNLFTLAVDKRAVRKNTMRVTFKGPFIAEVGSHIPVDKGNGNFVGIAAMNKEGAELLKYQLGIMAVSHGHENDYWSTAINILSESGILISTFSVEQPWIEIDTPEDLQRAQSMITAEGENA